MDWSILLSITGIIVSISIGLITFYVADRRSRRRKWHQAKETILMELSKSLGENNVPNLVIISATISSVLRNYNAEALGTAVIDEIVDDLIRQITSDPFLDSERRRQLQDQMLAVKNELTEIEETHEQKAGEKGKVRLKFKGLDLISIFVGTLAAILSALLFWPP